MSKCTLHETVTPPTQASVQSVSDDVLCGELKSLSTKIDASLAKGLERCIFSSLLAGGTRCFARATL